MSGKTHDLGQQASFMWQSPTAEYLEECAVFAALHNMPYKCLLSITIILCYESKYRAACSEMLDA